MQRFKPQSGKSYTMDVIPFEAGKHNPFAEEGELHFEATFFIHPRVGAAQDAHICNLKMDGVPRKQKKCFVCEYRGKLAKDPDGDDKTVRSLWPKERQLWLVYVHEEPDKGVQLYDESFHNFGKLLDSRVKRSKGKFDDFYYPDEDGMSLSCVYEEESGDGFTYTAVSSIDFEHREEDIDEDIMEQAVCLDDLFKISDYEELRDKFLEVEDDDDDDEPKKRKPKKSKSKKTRKDEEDEDDWDDEDEDDDDWDDDDEVEDDEEDDDWDDEDGEDEEEDDEPPKKSRKGSTASRARTRGRTRKEGSATRAKRGASSESDEDDDWDDDEEEDEPPKRRKKSGAKRAKGKSTKRTRGSAKRASRSKDDDWDDEEDEDDIPFEDEDDEWDDEPPKKRKSRRRRK